MRHLGSQEVRLYPLEPRTVDGTGRNLDEIHIYIQPPPGVTKLGATDLEFQCPPSCYMDPGMGAIPIWMLYNAKSHSNG